MATWRKKITLDHACSANTDQADFPFLIALEDPACTSLATDRLYFTLADGQTRIPHELKDYDPKRGALRAWVRIPLLASSTDTEIYLYCAAAEQERHPDAVWDEHHRIVQHLGDSADPDLQLPHSEALDVDTALTVQTWVHSDTYQAEAMQPLVSKWEPLATFDTFSSHDADGTDGLASRGFFGAVFDGQYVYGCPSRSENERTAVHGVVLRYNTLKDFRDPAAYEAYDAGHTDGLLTRGFYGGAFDGRYVYFNPRDDGTTHHSRFLRYDTHQNFKSSAAWEAYDAGLAHSFQGLAFDGRYLYCCPGYTKAADMPFGDGQASGKIMRFDTRANFKEATSYQTFDAQTLGSDVVCFDGAVFDGQQGLGVPVGVPCGGDPSQPAEVPTDRHHDQDRTSEEQHCLKQVGDHDGLQAAQGGVDDRDHARDGSHDGNPLRVQAHHHGHRFGGQVDQECHPDQSQCQEHRCSEQSQAQPQFLFQQFVRAGHTEFHVDRQHHEADDKEHDGKSEDRDLVDRPFAGGFTGDGEV